MDRRRFTIGTGFALLATLLPAARAQVAAPMRIFVGFQPGGSFDVLARVLAEPLAASLARPVLVENRVGAAGRIAMESTRDAKPGDAAVVVAQGAMTIFPYVYKNLRYDPVKDFTPIARLVTFDYALTTGPGSPATTVAEYVKWAKSLAGGPSYGSPGAGTTPHFLGVAFHQRIGVPATHVPYKGSALGALDAEAGRLPAMFSLLADTIERHRAGKLRVLAIASAARSPLLPEVPTMREAGIDLVVPGWIGLYGPAGMDAQTVAAQNAAVSSALRMASVQARLSRFGMTAAPSAPAELAALQRTELAMWGPIVRDSGFKQED